MLTIKRVFVFTIVLAGFLTCTSKIHAQVIINRFDSSSTSDVVEITNSSGSDVNLSGWIIKDVSGSGGSANPDHVAHTFGDITLSSGKSCSQSVGNSLNSAGDRIVLYQATTQISCVSYGDGNGYFCTGTTPEVAAPAAGQTASYSGNWTLGTEALASTSCELLTPTPTATPTPTPTPTSTATPTPTATSTPTPKPTTKVFLKATPKTDVAGASDETDNSGGSDESVSSLREGLSTPEPEKEKGEKKKLPIAAILFIVLGVGFMGGAGYLFLRPKLMARKLRNDSQSQSNTSSLS